MTAFKGESGVALPEGNELFRLLAEASADVIVLADLSGKRLYVSPGCRAYGYEPEELIGGAATDLVHPDDLEQLRANTAQVLRDGVADRARPREHRFRRKDGGWVWMEGNPAVLRDVTGAPTGIVNVFRDVTARKRAEVTLAEKELRLRLLLENDPDMVVQIGLDDSIVFVTPGCRRFGYTPEELIGRRRSELVHPEDLARLNRLLEMVQAGTAEPGPQDREYRIRNKAGDWVWVEGALSLLHDQDGKVVSAVSAIRDLTRRRALEDDLRIARAEAEAAAEVKAEFLANMSHELRTPLTSVVGFARLASEQPELSPLTREYVDRIVDASRALLTAVNDILDFSRLEAGCATIQPEPVTLKSFGRRTLDLFTPQAGAKDLHLVMSYDGPDDLAVMIDPDRVRQVLLNLIGNAVKFTPVGEVTLEIGYDDAAGVLTAAVVDTGPGIAPHALEKLFRRFSQVDGARVHGGAGLGLAICKGLVELMGGEIGVESVAGEGSRFWFRIPAEIVVGLDERLDPAEPDADPRAELAVLVADDHPANRQLVKLFLAGVGAEVAEAADGEDAVRLAGERRFDVILMDMRMPVLDGPGATRAIRARPGPNQFTPILAFTADADLHAAGQAEPLAFQGVITKPVEPAALIRAVAEAVGDQAPMGQEARRAGRR